MKLILPIILLSFSNVSFSQLLGIYEFTGVGSCPNQNPNVTTQPLNTEFDAFTMQNVFCVSTQNVFNTKSWNTTAELNTSEFIQFGLHTISCHRFTLDSLIFEYRNTTSGNTPTWHLRSSMDDYASDLATGISATVPNGMLADTIVFNSANFSLLADVKFRIYLTEMGSAGAAFRIDNVQLFGSETFVGTVDYYADNDGDGYGTGIALPACTNPGGYSLNNLDCDDNNANINPGTFWYQDNDGDGFGNDLAFEIGCVSTFANPVSNSDDCNDNNINLSPNTIWYQDLDGDGFGDDAITEMGCIIADLTIVNPVLIGGDCSDIASDLNPNTIWYSDNDGDGFGNPEIFEVACISSFFVPVMNGDDCDDTREFNYPGAIEICDEFDNNCDGINNEGFTTTVYYIDNDGDGYGSGSAGDFCNDPGIGYVLNNDDCNDDDNLINPGAGEIPGNFIDDNCDGIDEEMPHCDTYLDNDGDGFGAGNAVSQDLCDGPGIGMSYTNDDCDDNNANIFPGNMDGDDETVCASDGIDNDCDGLTDEGFDCFTCFGSVDTDMDGYDGGCSNEDCDDSNPDINPSATEIPNNGIDEDCDGQDLTNSISEFKQDELKIYPNPGTDNFFIASDKIKKGENSLKIVDLNGRLIFESKLTVTGNYFMEVPSANFLKGVYRIEIQNEKQIIRANWIKI